MVPNAFACGIQFTSMRANHLPGCTPVTILQAVSERARCEIQAAKSISFSCFSDILVEALCRVSPGLFFADTVD